MGNETLHLWDGYGVELEYMIVDRETHDVRPMTDQVLHQVAGEYASEIEMGDLSWSNELVLHVIELKTNGPAPKLSGLGDKFQADVRRINDMLHPMGAELMPTAAHPWMNPLRDTKLWPHEYNAVYEAFNRIFDCRGHGWSNLQCIHVNLPFSGDEEFGALHAAVRMVLPIIPALAASSPILDGKLTGFMDSRVDLYRNNARKIPMVSGRLIPEPVYTKAAYETRILQRLYDEMAPHDPDGVLRYEWANARGATARFDRSTIEIRLIDIQECPQADIAVTHAIASVVRALANENWLDVDELMGWDTEALNRVLIDTTRRAGHAVITDESYLDAFGLGVPSASAGELWAYLRNVVVTEDADYDPSWDDSLGTIIREGTLARRISVALHGDLSLPRMHEIYAELCQCLHEGRSFHAEG